MSVEILSVSNMYGPSLERLEREFTVHRYWDADGQGQAPGRGRAAHPRRADARASSASTAKIVDALPKLEIVSCFGVGVDAVDFEATRKRNVIVTNTPDVLNDCVADLALGLMIAAARRIPQGDAFTRAGQVAAGRPAASPMKVSRQAARHPRPGPHRPRHRASARRASTCRSLITAAARWPTRRTATTTSWSTSRATSTSWW